MTGIIDALYKRILLAAHPVGSVYQSTVETSPEELFGGSWTQIKDRFLLASGDTYAAGSTGGEASVALTVSSMPPHTHKFSFPYVVTDKTGFDAYMVGAGEHGKSEFFTEGTGNGQPHNNMPPYLTVYTWQRTS